MTEEELTKIFKTYEKFKKKEKPNAISHIYLKRLLESQKRSLKKVKKRIFDGTFKQKKLYNGGKKYRIT
jgi:hypothetical protein